MTSEIGEWTREGFEDYPVKGTIGRRGGGKRIFASAWPSNIRCEMDRGGWRWMLCGTGDGSHPAPDEATARRDADAALRARGLLPSLGRLGEWDGDMPCEGRPSGKGWSGVTRIGCSWRVFVADYGETIASGDAPTPEAAREAADAAAVAAGWELPGKVGACPTCKGEHGSLSHCRPNALAACAMCSTIGYKASCHARAIEGLTLGVPIADRVLGPNALPPSRPIGETPGDRREGKRRPRLVYAIVGERPEVAAFAAWSRPQMALPLPGRRPWGARWER